MKVHAMKNDPSHRFQELADIQFLMKLPGEWTAARSVRAFKRREFWSDSTSSKERSEPLDLDRGLPITKDDVEPLRKLRDTPRTDRAYVRFLASLPTPTHEELAAKRGPGGQPFRLR
jgi:hypothetical protein